MIDSNISAFLRKKGHFVSEGRGPDPPDPPPGSAPDTVKLQKTFMCRLTPIHSLPSFLLQSSIFCDLLTTPHPGTGMLFTFNSNHILLTTCDGTCQLYFHHVPIEFYHLA